MEKIYKIQDILSLPPQRRIKDILALPNPAELIHAMPDEEVWLTIKAAGKDEALPIIALTTKDQLQYILDLELWKKDRWLSDHALLWLTTIKACGDKKVLEWVYKTDPDTVILILKEFVVVFKKETQDDDPLDREWPYKYPPVTHDGVYYFQCASDAADEVVRPILDILARDDHGFYIRLCEAIMAELRTNLEESAFSWRTKRLAEKGFVPLSEALEVYRCLNDRRIASLPGKDGVKQEILHSRRSSLAVTGEDYPLLMLAMAGLKNEQVFSELVILANKIIIADCRPITPDTVAASMRKALSYTNIGLEVLSGADPYKAINVLKEKWVLNIFQLGYTYTLRLRQKARRFAKAGEDLLLLGDELKNQIEGVLRKKPLYYVPDNLENPYREFRTLDEIRKLEENIKYAEYITDMFENVFGLTYGEVRLISAEHPHMQWSTVLITIWARHKTGGDYKFSPVTEDKMRQLLRKIRRGSNKRRVFDEFLDWLIMRQPAISEDEKRFCKRFVEASFDIFLEEFADIEGDVSSQLIQSVWVIPKSV